MAHRASMSEKCNNNNNLDKSLHYPRSTQQNLFPFPGFTINNKTDIKDCTPIPKIPCKSVQNCTNSANSTEERSNSATTKTPPVEPSVSPEIQSSLFRSVLVSGGAPSTCYGAGHVISGVIDRRKCKARGILSAGHSKRGQDIFRKSSPTLIPCPTEASVSWHSSPKELSLIATHDTAHHTPQEERVLSLDFNGECEYSPFSDILSSGNVMQTPNSDSSLEGVKLKSQFESELDKVTDVEGNLSPWDPPRLSSEFEDLSPSSENVSESQMRISWRDELMSGSFDKDELDCCRFLSDEEIDADGLLKSPNGNNKETSVPTKLNPCVESICDDGGLTASFEV